MTQVFTYSLRKAQEERERKRRENDFKREDLLRYFNGHQALQHSCVFDEQSEATALRRRLHECQQQQQLLDKLDEAERQYKAKLEAEAVKDEEAQKAESARQALEREQRAKAHVIKESKELDELKTLLHGAKVKVMRDRQLVDRAQADQAAAISDRAFNEARTAERAELDRRERLEAEDRHLLARSAHDSLAAQLRYKELQKEEAKDLVDKEREQVNAAMAVEEEIDRREAEELVLKQKQEKQFIEEYLRDKRAEKLHTALDHAAEDARIKEYQQMIVEREKMMKEIEAAKKALLNMRYEKIKGKREEEMRIAQQEEELLNLLRAEEELEASKRAAMERKQKAQRMMQLMAEANQLQIQHKAQQAAIAKEEEEKMRQKLLARFAEEDRIEQMNAQRRRLKVEEHKREIARIIAEKRRLEDEAKRQEDAERDAMVAEERRKESIIEDERARLLAAAGPLQQYLPHSVLTNQKKLPPLMPAYLD